MSEMAYDFANFELLGQKCHMEIEKWNNKKRAAWFKAKVLKIPFIDFISQWYLENEVAVS
jgi:hypothetical protein